MKKKLLGVLLCAAMAVTMLGACGDKKDDSGSKDDKKTEESGDKKDDKAFKVGFVIRTQASPYYVQLAESVKEECEKLGWECDILDSNEDTAKEAENMETLVTQKKDMIFLDCIDPSACVPSIDKAAEAGIGVINLDSGVDEEANDITTVYSDNEQNGRLVGIEYAKKMGDTPIKAILLSGNKGSVAGQQRRTGLFCGIIEQRAGVSEEEAWKAAKEFEQQITDKGKAENKDAKFVVAGQGWGNWSEEEGLAAAEDLITANKDLNCVLGENDQMLFGAMTALENAGIKNVDLVAGADGAKKAYDMIKEGKQFATAENSPVKVAIKGVEIAKEILVDGKDKGSYDEVTMTEPAAVTKENVDEHYDFGF